MNAYNKFLLTYEQDKERSSVDVLNDFTRETGLKVEPEFVPDLLNFIDESRDLSFELTVISAEVSGIIPGTIDKLMEKNMKTWDY